MTKRKQENKPLSKTYLVDPYEIRKLNRAHTNPKKKALMKDQLERYSGSSLKDFQPRIILTNFPYYLESFDQAYGSKKTSGSAFSVCHSKEKKISIINFSIGAPNAVMIIEQLSVLDNLEAVLFLGLCGGLHRKLQIGEFIIPTAAIRGDGVTNHFLPTEAPALPAFKIQKFVSQILEKDYPDYWTGVIHTTGYRNWEFDETFKTNLYNQRALAVEMECAALFVASFVCKVPLGALLLVSDLPLKEAKTKKAAKSFFKKYTDEHLRLGIESMEGISTKGEEIRHHKF